MTAPETARQSSIVAKDRGVLVDRTTQRWVRFTGRRVDLDECLWLRGPVGEGDVIGTDFFARLADRESLTVVTDGPPRGLVGNFEDLAESACDPCSWTRKLRSSTNRPLTAPIIIAAPGRGSRSERRTL